VIKAVAISNNLFFMADRLFLPAEWRSSQCVGNSR
jgi:hypothetical protein